MFDVDGMGEDPDWQKIIEGLRSGNEPMVREFYSRYGPLLHGIADRRLAPEMQRRFDADDVIQSTFRTFFRRAKIGYFQFDDNQRLWNLLCAITLTKLREKLRYHSRKSRSVRRESSPGDSRSDNPPLEDDGRFASTEPAPDAGLEFGQTFEKVLQSLDEAERRLVELKLQDMTNDEAAEQLGMSERTVRRMLQRLQSKIQSLLDT